eukprot:scaffold3651_cov104-Cylindrotheca_fusiformis.AAC.1
MEEFDQGEIRRVPLDSVILMLKEMLHEEVIPVLEHCIEPPELDNIDRSFQSLHRWNFIESPDDQAEVTFLGSFVSALGIDLSLGLIIGLGIQFGVAAEAIEMAAVMSFPKTPFQITSQMFHDPATFNEITSATFVSRCHFDANLYSEPMSLMNALWDYRMAPNKGHWMFHYRIAIARMKQLHATRNNLRTRVAGLFGINEDKLVLEKPPAHMPHAKIMILRLLQVWVFSETIIEAGPSKLKPELNGAVCLPILQGMERLENSHLDQVLTPNRHPYEIRRLGDINQNGYFEHQLPFCFVEFVSGFEKRLVSYMIEIELDLACCYDSGNFYLFTNAEKSYGVNVAKLFDSLQESAASDSSVLAFSDPSIKRRGVLERKCGMWSIKVDGDQESRRVPEGAISKLFRRHHVTQDHESDCVPLCNLMNDALKAGEVVSVLFWEFLPSREKKKWAAAGMGQKFEILARGECKAIGKLDLQDLLGTKEVHSIASGEETTQIRFLPKSNSPLLYSGKRKNLFATTHVTDTSSWNRPLLNDVPEGARILSALVSSRRKGCQPLRFSKQKKGGDPEDTVDFVLDSSRAGLTKRWKRLGGAHMALVPEDSVPASAMTTEGPLFACCSNALELKGGRLRVEGITLLPPNPLFLLLAMLSFGLEPNLRGNQSLMTYTEEGDAKREQEKIRAAMNWLAEQAEKSPTNSNSDDMKWGGIDAKERIQTAISFHDSAADMGESLVCFPQKILELCIIFSFVDGYEVTPWESLGDKAFTEKNLARWRKESKTKINVKTPAPRFIKLSRLKTVGSKNDLQPEVTQTDSRTPSNIFRFTNQESTSSHNDEKREAQDSPTKANELQPEAIQIDSTKPSNVLRSSNQGPTGNNNGEMMEGHGSVAKANELQLKATQINSSPPSIVLLSNNLEPASIKTDENIEHQEPASRANAQTDGLKKEKLNTDWHFGMKAIAGLFATMASKISVGEILRQCANTMLRASAEWFASTLVGKFNTMAEKGLPPEEAQANPTSPPGGSKQETKGTDTVGETKETPSPTNTRKDKTETHTNPASPTEGSSQDARDTTSPPEESSQETKDTFTAKMIEKRTKEPRSTGTTKKEENEAQANPTSPPKGSNQETTEIVASKMVDKTKELASAANTKNKEEIQGPTIKADPTKREQPSQSDPKLENYPSTHILALLFKKYSHEVLGNPDEMDGNILLGGKCWEIFSYKTGKKGQVLYQARFINDSIPLIPLTGRGELPGWMKHHMRPSSTAEERKCIPPGGHKLENNSIYFGEEGSVLMYGDVAKAVRMEAAFWLERQFCVVIDASTTRHWYQMEMSEMIELLKLHAAIQGPTCKPDATRREELSSIMHTEMEDCQTPTSKAKSNKGGKIDDRLQLELQLKPKILRRSRNWFAVLPQGHPKLRPSECPSTHILAFLFKTYSHEVLGNPDEMDDNILLGGKCWEIFSYKTRKKGQVLYQARFINDSIPLIPLTGRGELPAWMNHHMRPSSTAEERKCIPPGGHKLENNSIYFGEEGSVLMYGDVEKAVRMEAAFWLERQFCVVIDSSTTRHWYQMEISEMIQILKQHATSHRVDSDRE